MSTSYAWQFIQLLPRGKAWTRSLLSNFYKLALGVAHEFRRHADDFDAFVDNEVIPTESVELLPDWERVYGLPDDCSPEEPTLVERQQAVAARIAAQGSADAGTGEAFLQALSEALGYTEIIIRRNHLPAFTCESACDEALYSDEAGWPFVWELIVRSSPQDDRFVCEVAGSGLIHLEYTHAFPLVFFEDLVVTRASTQTYTHPITGNQTELAVDEVGRDYIGV